MDKSLLDLLLKQDASHRELGTAYKAGQPVFSQGDSADCLYVIQKGKMEILLETGRGEKQIAILGVGDVFGETSLFAEKPRFTTVRALDDARAVKIDKRTFLTKLHLDPSLAYGVICKMAKRIYELDNGLLQSMQDYDRPDKFTGFSSYQDIGELLSGEVSRAKRLLHMMAFVVLDIERYKEILSVYGPVASEQVLMTLAQVLRRHLRSTDVVGRYGRDRFGVILFETDGSQAVEMMEKVRNAFAEIKHSAGGKSFHATFNCGIALLPEQRDAVSLRKAATRALKKAKRNRDRHPVFLAEPGVSPKKLPQSDRTPATPRPLWRRLWDALSPDPAIR